MKALPPHLRSRFAERWLAELNFLEESLAHAATAPQSWRWKIRLRILSFLVSRYGEQTEPWRQPHDRVSHDEDSTTENVLIRREPDFVGTRSRDDVRGHLHRIRTSNDACRHVMHESMPVARDLSENVFFVIRLLAIFILLWTVYVFVFAH